MRKKKRQPTLPFVEVDNKSMIVEITKRTSKTRVGYTLSDGQDTSDVVWVSKSSITTYNLTVGDLMPILVDSLQQARAKRVGTPRASFETLE